MTYSAWIELARRAVALVLAVAAATAALGYGRWDIATATVVLAAAAYGLLPRPKLPPGALHHERLPSVYMPDLLGLLLATTFLSAPFIVSAREGWSGVPWGLMLLMWPPGLIALAIFWVAAGYQCLWVLVGPHALTVNTRRGTAVLPYESITGVSTDTTRPPRWLGPLLILFGGWRGAGVAILHANRQSHWIVIERRDSPPLRLPADAFPAARKIVGALSEAGIPVAAELAGRQRRPKKERKSDGSRVLPTDS